MVRTPAPRPRIGVRASCRRTPCGRRSRIPPSPRAPSVTQISCGRPQRTREGAKALAREKGGRPPRDGTSPSPTVARYEPRLHIPRMFAARSVASAAAAAVRIGQLDGADECVLEVVVDLPAPFGPRNPVISPSAAVKSTPRRASTLPKRLTRPSTSITAPAPFGR